MEKVPNNHSTPPDAKRMLADGLSKEKAIELMMKGYKMKHKYFDNDEYIEIPWGGVFRLSGKYTIHQSTFWHDRQGEHWETGWEIVGQ